MSVEQRESFSNTVLRANYFWVFCSVVLSFMSHVLRAHRWKYLLEPLGHTTSFWHRFHAVMFGYIMNILIARVGEASRAGVLVKTDHVPFARSFGTIIAERAIDLCLLGLTTLLTIAIGFDDFIQLKERLIDSSAKTQSTGATFWVMLSLLFILTGGILAFIISKKLRAKVHEMLHHLKEGILSVFNMEKPFAFLFHSIMIWVLYVLFFYVGLWALPEIATKMTFSGVLLAFIGGAVGIVFVQGGIGAYPFIVGSVMTYYVFPEKLSLQPEASCYALANILWAAQTLLLLVLGLVSLFYLSRKYTLKKQ